MCLSIGTPKIINFPFVPNGKFIIFRCPKIWANYNLIIMCSNTGTPNNHHFLFGTNGKVVVLGVPILKHFRVNNILWTHFPIFVHILNDVISKLLVSPSKFSGTRKFTLRYQKFELNFDFEISRAECG